MRALGLSLLFVVGCTTPLEDVASEVPDTPDETPEPIDDEPDPWEEHETVTPDEDCPIGMTCVNVMPYVDHNTTTGGLTDFDSYDCAPEIDESGPEVVYKIELAEDGVLFGAVTDEEGVDVDVHLLQILDERSCVQRGHLAAGVLAEAGTWYVVVDSWVDGNGVVYDGDYTLELGHTTANAYVDDGLDADVLDHALYAWDKAWFWEDISRSTLAIVDFTKPSNEHRTWILDLATQELLFQLYTSHGQGSQDPADITAVGELSNTPQSNQSSLGVMRGSESYYGNFGYSMRIDGLEPGFNDNVRNRAIVLHRGDYATEEFVHENGYCGRSNGCFVYDPDVTDQIVDALSDGGMIFAWWPDPLWLRTSEYLSGY